jgi:transposase
MEQVTTVGIDLAKRVFALHAVDSVRRVVLRNTVRREALAELVAGMPPLISGTLTSGTDPIERGVASKS